MTFGCSFSRENNRPARGDAMSASGMYGAKKADIVTKGIPFRVQLMLATRVSEPFNRSGWVYEIRRRQDPSIQEGNRIRPLSGNGTGRTNRFLRIAAPGKFQCGILRAKSLNQIFAKETQSYISREA